MAARNDELRVLVARAIVQVRAANAALEAGTLDYEELHALEDQLPVIQRLLRLTAERSSSETIDDLGGWDAD